MKTKWYVLCLVAFILGVVFSVSMAFQPGKKDTSDKTFSEKPVSEQKTEIKVKPATKPYKVDSVGLTFLPDSVINKLKEQKDLEQEVETNTVISNSKTKDINATNESLLKQVVKLEKVVQKVPYVEPLPGKSQPESIQPVVPDSVIQKPELRKRSFFNRLFHRK